MSVRGWIHTRSRSCWISSSRRRHVSWRTFTSWSFFSSAASSWAIFSAGRAISATPSSPPPAATLLLLLVSQAEIERPREQKSRPRSSLSLFPVPSPDEFVRQRAASSAGFPKGTARTNVFPGPAFKLSQTRSFRGRSAVQVSYTPPPKIHTPGRLVRKRHQTAHPTGLWWGQNGLQSFFRVHLWRMPGGNPAYPCFDNLFHVTTSLCCYFGYGRTRCMRGKLGGGVERRWNFQC